ncbi:MAG TPA: hypothetical protein VHP33_30205 [Polyangiaceae bacterium]|nr:hypothetical protein [Polyangiaceae bacterium]
MSVGVTLTSAPAEATLVRGLTLAELAQKSGRIGVLEPLDASCRYVSIGGRRSLVTDTRVRVHEVWTGAGEPEILLRTLGGRKDGVGELVHGQPELRLGTRAVGFLKLGRDGQAWWMTGMAQGHFPLTDASQAARLLASPSLPDIVRLEASAVKRLVGRQLGEARELVRRARQP